MQDSGLRPGILYYLQAHWPLEVIVTQLPAAQIGVVYEKAGKSESYGQIRREEKN